MTNEERIERLKKIRSVHNGSYAEDIDYVIELLRRYGFLGLCEDCMKKRNDVIHAYNKMLEQTSEDCISREAVIKAVDKHTIETEKGLLLDEDISIILEDLPSIQPKKGEWIPVTERLPEEKQSVLVWCPQYKNIYCAYLEKEQWWIFGAFVQIVPNEVIAWQPLPEPYKEDKE